LELTEEPQPDLLIQIPNQHQEVDYSVSIEAPEFTSLCPLNLSQPDFATISIEYDPREWLVELKSLKFYLTSFRQCPVFHEEVPSIILKALVSLLEPRYLTVTGKFTTRGGIDTSVTANYAEDREVGDGI